MNIQTEDNEVTVKTNNGFITIKEHMDGRLVVYWEDPYAILDTSLTGVELLRSDGTTQRKDVSETPNADLNTVQSMHIANQEKRGIDRHVALHVFPEHFDP
jgi:hypothetical protein